MTAPLLLLLFAFSSAAPPAWLPAPAAPPPAPPAAAPAPLAAPPPRPSVRVVRDTVVRVDTLRVIDTVEVPAPPPAYYSYSVRYEIVDRKLAMRPGFEWLWEKTAQKTILQSSDTTLLSLGNETLRESSFTLDDRGNRTQTYEKLIEGLDMRISGQAVNITYRSGSSLLTLNGSFDKFGLLQLSSDFERRRYFLYFIPLDFLFGSEKYTLFLRVEKKEANL